MSNAKWSEGPWEVEFSVEEDRWQVGMDEYLEDPGCYRTADLWFCESADDRAESNAHIISAAPEMYEALEICRSALQQFIDPEKFNALINTAMILSDQAMEKARGE